MPTDSWQSTLSKFNMGSAGVQKRLKTDRLLREIHVNFYIPYVTQRLLSIETLRYIEHKARLLYETQITYSSNPPQ
jgi:hypothetical protein